MRQSDGRGKGIGLAAFLALLGATVLGCHVAPPEDDPVDEFEIPTSGELEAFVAGFGTLETVAGAGQVDREGESDWQAAFEGGSALAAELSRPHTAMADGAGVIYVADKDSHAIRRIDLDGTIHTHAGMNAAGDDGDDERPATTAHLRSPNGLWVRDDGVVYVLDTGNQRVCRVDLDGQMKTVFRSTRSFGDGRGLWVADDESLIYLGAGDEVLRWTVSQGVQVFASGFTELGALMPGPDGGLLVCDRGAHRVYRLSTDGRSKEVVAGNGERSGRSSPAATATAMNGVRAIWAREDGSLLLGTHEGSQVWFVDSLGQADVLLDGLRGVHAGDGDLLTTPGPKLSEVRSVVITPQGDLLIVEHDAGYIRRVRHR